MKTALLKASSRTIAQAAAILRDGDLVAFPTETVYGLGADAFNPQAVAKIFKAKGRPSDNPLIVHIASKKDLMLVVRSVPPFARLLIDRFWPGPLTLVLPKTGLVPKMATGGLDTVAVRMPDHPAALALIRAAKTPIAAPSANRSGRPSPTSARHVQLDLEGRIDAILDGGPSRGGVESTVLDVTGKIPIILRPGQITPEQVEQVVGPVIVHSDHAHNPRLVRSPGMKYRHYAPRAKLILVEGNPKRVQGHIDRYRHQKKKVGVLAFHHRYRADNAHYYGRNLRAIARDLFAILREFDGKKMDVIFCETLPKKGLGLAIMDRLGRAAGRRG